MFTITIEYCKVWHYTDKAVSLTAALLAKHEEKIESVKLIPGTGGKFEIRVNGKLVYSKMATGRHANPGEVEKLVAEAIQGR